MFEQEESVTFETYYDFLMYLNEGEVLTSEEYPELEEKYNGVCDDFCESLEGICGFADAGMNPCSAEGSSKCTCYNQII